MKTNCMQIKMVTAKQQTAKVVKTRLGAIFADFKHSLKVGLKWEFSKSNKHKIALKS